MEKEKPIEILIEVSQDCGGKVLRSQKRVGINEWRASQNRGRIAAGMIDTAIKEVEDYALELTKRGLL